MKSSLKRFLDLLCGEYSNQKQAIENPPFFAHIFLKYKAINHLQPGSILLEQSYAVDPKKPYRLRMIRAEETSSGTIKLWNHAFKDPKQFTEAMGEQTQIKDINEEDLILLDNCHYHVVEKDDGYHGGMEAGCRCIVCRDGKDSYLKSSFHLEGNKLSTLDRGYDLKTNERLWGSIAGEFQFIRTSSWKAEWH